MTQDSDIVIIGGGVSGLLTARALRLAGREVTVIDKGLVGQESSWAGGGILLPIYPWRQPAAISDLVMLSLQAYPVLQAELLSATGIDPEWQACGMLICKNPDLEAALAWCQQRGVTYQLGLPASAPSLATEMAQPLWLPDIAQIRNPRLLKSLKAYLLQLGVKIVEQVTLDNIVFAGDKVTEVHTSQQRFGLQQLVISAGAWSAELLQSCLPEAGPGLAIKPVKGQMLVFGAEANTLSQMVLDADQYLIPRRDGSILAGSTVESVGFDKTTTAEAKQALYEFATGLLPELKRYPVTQHWAGLRPASPQGVPTIGLHPRFTNLAINVGHFRNGLVMGPASAQLLADLILQRPLALDPASYRWNPYE